MLKRQFPVRLEFFKKGRQFFLHLSGKAFIVTDPEEINGLVHDDIREQAAGSAQPGAWVVVPYA